MIRRDGPVELQPAEGLGEYKDFSKPEVLAGYRAALAESTLPDGKLPENVTVEWVKYHDVRCAKILIDGAREGKLIFQIHGGAWNGGVPCTGQRSFIELQQDVKVNIVSVDYGLAPEHPYPDGLNDCIAAYEGVLEEGYQAEDIVFLGESAGGNLCLCVPLAARDRGLPLPGGIALVSPAALPRDFAAMEAQIAAEPQNLPLKEDYDTYNMYNPKHDMTDPYIYPILGDFKGFPPVLNQFGGAEFLTQDGIAITQKLMQDGVDVKAHMWENMPHVFVLMNEIQPESTNAKKELADFINYILD